MKTPLELSFNRRLGSRGSRAYNETMTILPAPSVHTDLLDRAGFLTAADRARISDALLAAYAPGTRRTYTQLWRLWSRWCAERDLAALPADPAAVCAYLTERAAAGITTGTLAVTCSAIGYAHREAGLPNPLHDPTVARVRRGLRRRYGTAPLRAAHPLDTTEIAQITAAIDRTNPTGARDAALILLGYAAALRPGELAALDLADLTRRRDGLLLAVRAAKTDPERAGQTVAVAAGQHPVTCPLAAVAAWLVFRGTAPGPLFPSLRGRMHRTPGHTRRTDRPTPGIEPVLRPMIATTVSDIVHNRAAAAGLEATRITGHSLRAGHATTAALAGVPLHRIAVQTRHRQVALLLDRYVRPAQTLPHSSSRDLGL